MKTFQQFITEAFDSPYPFQLKKAGSRSYESIVELPDSSELAIMFAGQKHMDDYDELDWEITFSRTERGRPSMELTGQGDQMRILATVIAAIQEFVKKENPKYLNFSAAKDDRAAGMKDKFALQSREKLYARFVKKYFAKDYNIDQRTGISGTVWYLERKK